MRRPKHRRYPPRCGPPWQLVAEGGGGGGGNNSGGGGGGNNSGGGGGPAASGGPASGGHTNGGPSSHVATGHDDADPKLTKERLTIAATIGFRHAIMAATMNEQLHATTMTPMVIVTTVMDISFTVCGSGMAPPMLITTAIG
jgi:hypothetical protein